MTTTATPPSLFERAAAAWDAERSGVEQKASAAEAERLLRQKAILMAAIGQTLDWHGDIDVTLRTAKQSTDYEIAEYVAVVDGLTFKVNGSGNPSHALNDALVLTGAGAVELLGFPPNQLLFSNSLASAVTVSILVGRLAT